MVAGAERVSRSRGPNPGKAEGATVRWTRDVPGFDALSPTRALVSYSSSHEKEAAGRTITAIYLAELTLPP
jgi:hypothetical protein